MLNQYHKYHFIGIGGIGMCGLAELLKQRGYHVTGSDLTPSENTSRLEKIDIKIYYSHKAANLQDVEVVVYTSAISDDNPELVAARTQGLLTIKRARLLGEIFRTYPHRIAVSGTHGKTTTTALIGSIFTAASHDPMIIGGGILPQSNSPVRIGSGNVIIAEADEFDRSFLQLYPSTAVITTIEPEHLDCYASIEDIKATFLQFVHQTDNNGAVVICTDEPAVREIQNRIEQSVFSYGINYPADWMAQNINLDGNGSSWEVIFRGKKMGTLSLQIPGNHNIKNALAALAVAHHHGIDWQSIKKGLEQFSGVRRRMEIVAQSSEVILMDDYAHHPTEIKATLTAARQGWHRRLVAIFQPHLYTRTRDFYLEFSQALALADIVILLDIYPAREKALPGISSKLIFDQLVKAKSDGLFYVGTAAEAIEQVLRIFQPGDLIITLGAGNVNQILEPLKAKLIEKP